MQAIFTGLDSAWGAANYGAFCDLLLEGDSLWLSSEPIRANWDSALGRARQKLNADLWVWAIDQPLVVANAEGCRAVERELARALMGDFGCGAHSSNTGLAPWAKDSPVWTLLRTLGDEGYVHDPMSIPGAVAGRFYFECYPHPAIIGIFDLDRILQYKVHHRNIAGWRTLIRLIRSLDSAEFAIGNIQSFVPEDFPATKSNEDKLDSIISAYTAAYWWRFGARRSTLLGDLSSGYIVTPHSTRAFEALARVFAGRMNHCGIARTESTDSRQADDQKVHDGEEHLPAQTAPAPRDLPRCDWVYFATPAKWSGTITREFIKRHKVIVRSLHNSNGMRIANVQHLQAGQRILLAYGGHGREYRAVFKATIATSASPVLIGRYPFHVFTYLNETLDPELRGGGYRLDPVTQRFVGIAITDIEEFGGDSPIVPRPSGNNAIWRWESVFEP